jgi:chemotaxis protein MotA
LDIATLIGLLGGTGLIFAAVMYGGDLTAFINIPGLLIVIGGTFAACFVKFSMKDVVNSFAVVMKAFIVKMDTPEEVIQRMVNLAKLAKKEGLIALEGSKNEVAIGEKGKRVGDAFMDKALNYLSDGYDEEMIEDLLNKDIRITAQRHSTGQNVFKGMGAAAPAFGMIGTLIGLVQMLANMSEPSNIGPAMAVALLTTLYGALIANLVCLPLADKLALRSQQELETRHIILDAAIAMNRGITPMVLEESLRIYLSPKERQKVEENKKGKKDAKGSDKAKKETKLKNEETPKK